ncbi:hypothetical protein Cs7R123_48260 [Catellatospora sp. TT07R-123]|uniref:hypothetical protein n=1 Tax=Catellatospora sp. TT07R-123 TaxID=2733863 RepID=UPI001B0DDC2F|nr:hypothetical protein [Catellatospora sp. TT07R-123]GHJ47484.1 hypothetical protein Cs7R123_48260 [Catellatospora sp. TT07R-123]
MTDGPAAAAADAADGSRRVAARAAAPAPAPAAPTVAAREVVRRIAPHLGLDPDTVPLRVTESSLLGASPAAADGQGLLLCPSAMALADAGVLAHELAHVAQHRNRVRPSASAHLAAVRPDVTAAEAEAAAVTAAVRAGGDLWLPRAVLPDGHVARFDGASGIAPAVPAAPGEVDRLTTRLTGLVRVHHAAELAAINNELDAVFTGDRSKREFVLRMIEPLPFVIARVLVRLLSPERRRMLALVDDRHHREHPEAAAAVLAALDRDDLAALGDRLARGQVGPQGPTTDADVPLHGVNLSRLGEPARRAVYLLLQSQSDAGLARLAGGDRRQYFREVMSGPAPLGDDAADLRTAVAAEERMGTARDYSLGTAQQPEGVDTHIVTSVTQILRHHNADAARAALDAFRPMVEAMSEPVAAPATNAPPLPHERMRAVVTELDRNRLVDVILDHLPSADRRRFGVTSGEDYGLILARLLAARAPGLTLPRIESLLSYGVFDWAVTDDDARLAYLLVRSLPLAEQDAWRRRDGGFWFERLQDNLPNGMVADGEYTGVGTEYLAEGPGGSSPDGTHDLLRQLIADWDAGPHRADAAEQIVRRLAAEAEPEQKTAVIRRLDTMGVLDGVLERLTDEFLVNDESRVLVDRVASRRDPLRLERQATRLLSTGLFDWWISAYEAWLAHLLLRALPPAEQRRWSEEHPNLWGAMMSAMTGQMRRSAAAGAMTGRDGFPTLAQLHERLRDTRLWDGEHDPQLRALLLLAYASDDRRWVYDLSREYADLTAHLGLDLQTTFGLYHPVYRPDYAPEHIDVPGTFTELLSVLWGGLRLVLYGAGMALYLAVEATGRTLDLDVDLETAQWAMGEDLAGAQLTPRAQSIVGGTTAADRALRDHTNRLELHLDPGNGAFRMRVEQLRLNRFDASQPGASYRAGFVTLRDLRVIGSFSDRHYRAPIGFDLSMQSADVRDLVIANESVGGVALAHLLMQTLRMRAGSTGAEDLAGHQPRDGWVGVPVLGPLLQLIDNMVMLLGGLPGSPSITDLMALGLPATGLPWLADKVVGSGRDAVVNHLIPNQPHPLDYVYGLVSDGTPRPPRSVTERLGDAARMLRSLQVSLGDLEIEGASFGAGTQVSSIRLHGLAAGVARSRPAYLRSLITSLNERIPTLTGSARTAAITRRDAALDELDRFTIHAVRIRELRARQSSLTPTERAELTRLVEIQNLMAAQRRAARAALSPDDETVPERYLPPTEAELRMEELERRDRWIAGSLTPAERAELARLNTLVRSDVGATLDVAGIDIGEVSGSVELAGAHIGPVHLDVRVPESLVPAASGSYLADPELIGRFRRGVHRPTAADLRRDAEVNLSVGGVTITPAPGGGPAVRLPAGSLPTAHQLTMRYLALPINADPQIRERLGEAMLLAMHVEELEARGHLADETAERHRLRDIQESRQRLTRLLGIDVGSLSLGPVSGRLDEHGRLVFTVDGVDAHDIAGPSWRVGRATGSVHASVGLDGLPGTAGVTGGFGDFARAARPQVGADMVFENVQFASGHVARVAVQGLQGTVTPVDGGVHIPDLTATSVRLEGLRLSAGDTTITGASVVLGGVAMDLRFTQTGSGDAQVTDVRVATLHIARISGMHLVYFTRDADSELRVEITEGALGDIHGTNLYYRTTGDDGPTAMGGDLTVGGLDAHYQAISTVLGTHPASTQVDGALSGGVVPPAGADPLAHPNADAVLRVGFASDGANRTVRLDAAGLAATDVHVTGEGQQNLTIRRIPIGAHVDMQQTAAGGTVVGGSVDLTGVEVGAVDWRTGTKRIRSTGGGRIGAVHLAGRYESRADGGPGVPAHGPRLRVTRMDLEHIDFANLHYHDAPVGSPALDLQLGRLDPHPGALRIQRVHMHDFVLPFDHLDQFDLAHAGAQATITGLHVDARLIRGALRARGELDVQRLDVRLSSGGSAATAHGYGAGGIFEVDYDDPGGPSPAGGRRTAVAAHQEIAFYNADTGEISITPSTIEIAGLHVPELDVTSLNIGWGTAGYLAATGRRPVRTTGTAGGTVTSTSEAGAVYLRDIRADVRVDRHTGRIALRTFTIDRIDAEGIELALPGLGTFGLPIGAAGPAGLPPLTHLDHVRLGGSTPDGFVIVPGTTSTDLIGTVHADQLVVPHLRAALTGRLTGDLRLSTDAIDVELPASGPMRATIVRPHAETLSPAALAGGATVGFGSLDAAEVRYTGAHYVGSRPVPGHVGADDIAFRNIEYRDLAGGVTLRVAQARALGTTGADLDPVRVRFPDLEIDDANLEIDFAAPGSGGSGGTPTAIHPSMHDLGNMLLDRFTGDVPVSVTIENMPMSVLGVHSIDMHINLHFVDGRIDTHAVASAIVGSITFTPPSSVLGTAGARVRFRQDGNRVMLEAAFGVYNYNLATWNISDPAAVALFAASGEMRLSTIIDDLVPTPSSGSGPSGVTVRLGPRPGTADPATLLDVANPAPIPITLSGGVSGHVTLAPHVVGGATGHGELHPLSTGGARSGLVEDLGLGRFTVQETNLTFGGGMNVTTRRIEVTGADSGRLELADVTPGRFNLHVTRATARGVVWTMPP